MRSPTRLRRGSSGLKSEGVSLEDPRILYRRMCQAEVNECRQLGSLVGNLSRAGQRLYASRATREVRAALDGCDDAAPAHRSLVSLRKSAFTELEQPKPATVPRRHTMTRGRSYDSQNTWQDPLPDRNGTPEHEISRESKRNSNANRGEHVVASNPSYGLAIHIPLHAPHTRRRFRARGLVLIFTSAGASADTRNPR